MIVYDRYWFNPVYYHIEKYIHYPEIRYIFVYGGKSSSKTFSIVQLFEILVLEQGIGVAAFRRELTRMKDSIRKDAITNLRNFNIDSAYEILEYELRCNKYPKDQALFRMKGMEDENAVKGIAGFKYALLDELDHFEVKLFRQANASFRGVPEQKLFATWNPISEDHWIKKEWIDKREWIDLDRAAYPVGHKLHNVSKLSNHSSIRRSKDGSAILIKTNFFDNKWVFGGEDNGVSYGVVDENLIKLYASYEEEDPEFYRVNVLGEWGTIQAENPFVRNLNYNTQVGLCNYLYKKNLPVYCTLDFNEKWTALIKQIQGDKIYYFKCFHDYPENIMEQIALEYGHYEMYFTGDFAGNSNNQYTNDNSKKTAWKLARTLYNEACVKLYKRKAHEQENAYADFSAVPTNGNIGIAQSRTIVNRLLFNWGERVMFDKVECRDLINDCKRIEATSQGGINKEEMNRKNICHWLDCLRYDHSYFHYQDFLQLG